MASAAHRHASKKIGVETPQALLKTLTAGTLLALGPQRQIGPDPGTSAPNWLGTPDLGGAGSPRGGLVGRALPVQLYLLLTVCKHYH